MSFWKKYGNVLLGGLETALDLGGDWLTGGTFSKIKGKIKKNVKRGLKIAEVATGTTKDWFAGGDSDFDWSTEIGDLKNGLANAQSQIESQGQALRGELAGVKSELQNELQQQGKKFEQEIKALDAKIATATGEIKIQLEQEKKERQRQIQQLQVAINQVSDELNRVENKLTEAINDLREEVNERFAQHEQKILDNKRKIQEEKLAREEEIREVNSNIKLTNTNLENLRQEKSQLEDEFLNYKSTIDRKTAETEQLFEESQAEYERRTRIIETKMSDQENLLQDFQDNLLNVQNEQVRQNLYQQELAEELQEQSDLLHFQKHQLNLVSQQMEDITEEIHDRMSKVEKDHNSLLNLANETNQKLGNLTAEVQTISQKTQDLESQIQENKQNIEKVKQEAQLANERLDNYLKTQSLLNFDQEEQNIARIQQSIQLKAEETKLLATLKLLEETKKLISPKSVIKNQDREWKVGVKEGTEREMPRREGMPLDPNCRWAKEYTPEQLAEWGWDVRIHNENNETAPLTTEDKRIEEKLNSEQSTEEKTIEEENNENNELIFEQLEDAKTELLTRLQEIQSEVNKNLNSAEKQKESNQSQTNSAPKNLAEELDQAIQQSQEKELKNQQENLTAEWESIQQISQQVLTENHQEITPELDLQQKLEELAQQLQELEASQVANQKQMTKWMLFVIIFLLEYVVYKKNGILGLILLNVVLAILYYKKDAILEHRHLWEKYFLIIGYIIGNTLAYSAPEQAKYKWPSVIAFNLITFGIYGYTLYQNKHEEKKLEQIFNQKTAQICQENNITSEEWKTAHNSNFVANKQEQLTNLAQLIKDQEILHQKALELQQQTELCQRSAEIEKNLQKIHNNLGERKISWTKIKESYPEFAERSILLKEIALADKFLYKEERQELNNSFLTKLQRIDDIASEESALLSKLKLTREQLLAISQQAVHFNKEDKEYLNENYANLDNHQKLSLLNGGLNNLGIDNLDKKKAFVQLNQRIHQEKNNFGLSTQEKENILRLLINTLSLSPEQQNYLEKMGISFFNASEWTINNAQKNQLLNFGLQRINLNQKQKASLVNLATNQFKVFVLSEEQKNILQSLAPLTKEEKYSESSLDLLNSLQLKQTSLKFFVSEEIIPDPNTDFGKPTNPYLPLKTKFLLGEQKVLQLEEKEKQKQLKAEQIQSKKLSIIQSLLLFGKSNKINVSYSEIIKGANKDQKLAQLTYSLADWVKNKALTIWQQDILLTLGLKTLPKYNFFELLKFAVERINNQSLTNFLQENNWLQTGYQKYLELEKSKTITINKVIWNKFISANSQEKNIFKGVNLEQLINKQIQQALSNYSLKTETSAEKLENISSEARIAELKAQLSEKEQNIKIAQKKLTNEIPRDSWETDQGLQNWIQQNQTEIEQIKQELREISEPIVETPIASRYDQLLDSLNSEDQARQKKKQEREAAKKKLEDSETARRQAKLSEKDRKLKEEEERRNQEIELANQEEQKRREAEEIRQKNLQEEQTRIFEQKLKNIEKAKKRAEENLANQQKANELAEQKKRDEITKLERENQQEQERLAKQAELIEEQKVKQLEAIALEDKEARQLIEKRANEEKARIESEMNEKKRKNEEELKAKENALLREKQEKQLELEKLQKEVDLQSRIAEETKRIGREQERILKASRDKEGQLRNFRDSLWQEVKNYYWASNEARDGTRNPNITSGGYLRDWLNSHPNLQFNLVGGDQFSVNWTNNSWKTAMQAFYRTAGNSFVDQYQFKRLLDEKVKSLDFLN